MYCTQIGFPEACFTKENRQNTLKLFLAKKMSTHIVFQQNKIRPKNFWAKKSLTQKIYSANIFFDDHFFSDKKSFESHFLLNKQKFYPIFITLTFFSTHIYFYINKFRPTFFLQPNFFSNSLLQS